MKVKDLFVLEGCWDVYENIADLIGVAFCCDGDDPLTEEGKEHFKKALNTPIKRIDKNMIVIDTEKVITKEQMNKYSFEDGDCPKLVENLIELFWSLAGYCSKESYEKYFVK